MNFEHLKLENQLCFPVYAASRLITREYKPFLDILDLTYPQYLVLLVLWESNELSVNEISSKLILNTNTLTPLLKRMEKQKLIVRTRSSLDERKVIIKLTDKGLELKEPASEIPIKLIESLQNSNLSIEKLLQLKDNLNSLIDFLLNKENE